MSTVLIAYVPALHNGYLPFFKKHAGSLYLLGDEFTKDLPYLDRDIRAVDAELMKKAIQALEIFDEVEVLDASVLKTLKEKKLSIVLPDEDISHTFVKKHLRGRSTSFVNIFLRWDKHISTAEHEISPSRTISYAALDNELVQRAHSLAQRSPDWWRQVGAVAVKNGSIVLTGYNRPLIAEEYTFGAFGDPRSSFEPGINIELSKVIHAESSIIAEAAKNGISLDGTSLYVTTFPCPVCAKLVAASGVKKVYYSQGYSLLDAEEILRVHGVELVMVRA